MQSQFPSTGSGITSVGMLLRESELLKEDKEKQDDQRLDATMMEGKMEE